MGASSNLKVLAAPSPRRGGSRGVATTRSSPLITRTPSASTSNSPLFWLSPAAVVEGLDTAGAAGTSTGAAGAGVAPTGGAAPALTGGGGTGVFLSADTTAGRTRGGAGANGSSVDIWFDAVPADVDGCGDPLVASDPRGAWGLAVDGGVAVCANAPWHITAARAVRAKR